MNRIFWNAVAWSSSGIRIAALAAAVVAAGCASYSGSNLVPGKSTAAEVEATMGPAREKLVIAGGVTRWFYPRGPMGQVTYAVNVSADGIVQGVEQTLTRGNVEKLKAGSMTSKEVLGLLGPPNKIVHFEAKERDNWEYRMVSVDWMVLTLEISNDGLLRGVNFLADGTQYLAPGSGECTRC